MFIKEIELIITFQNQKVSGTDVFTGEFYQIYKGIIPVLYNHFYYLFLYIMDKPMEPHGLWSVKSQRVVHN